MSSASACSTSGNDTPGDWTVGASRPDPAASETDPTFRGTPIIVTRSGSATRRSTPAGPATPHSGSATASECANSPVLLYTRTPEYVRGAVGEIAAVAYESPAPEDETWGLSDAQPEWFYVVRFTMGDLWHSYTGPADDTLQTEIPERWLASAGGEDERR